MFNPAYYGLDNTGPEALSSYLSRLVQNTFEDLEDSGCIKMNEDNVEPTMLGSIASQYYLSYMTVSMFGSSIGSYTSLEHFNFSLLLFMPLCLRRFCTIGRLAYPILSAASEYNAVPVRPNELELPFSDYVTGLILEVSIGSKYANHLGHDRYMC
ncbi:unnamed protein product [Prunus armeniaca]